MPIGYRRVRRNRLLASLWVLSNEHLRSEVTQIVWSYGGFGEMCIVGVRGVEDDGLMVFLFDRGHQARAARTNLVRRCPS